MTQSLSRKLPTAAAVEEFTRKRLPDFAFDYVVGGIDAEVCKSRDRAALDRVTLTPAYRKGTISPSTQTTLFGCTFDIPFGVAPVGGGDFIWAGAGAALAAATAKRGLLFIPGTMTCVPLETVRAISKRHNWFQLYPSPCDDFLRRSLRYLVDAGVRVLVLTVDLPSLNYRWREEKHALVYPPKFTPRILAEVLAHPQWALAILKNGVPAFPNIERFAPPDLPRSKIDDFLDEHTGNVPNLEGFKVIRDQWPGTLVVKGILSEADLLAYKQAGADGAVVSNHGGRQLDAAPAAIEALPRLRAAAGDEFPLLADGQCWTGLDIARFIASGADFVLAGRAPYMTVAAGGAKGADYFVDKISVEFKGALSQLGCPTPKDLPRFLGTAP